MSDVQDQEWFVRSCSEAAFYPRNLVYHDTYEHNLKAYVERLDERESLLFCKESTSILDIWEYDADSQSFQGACLPSLSSLKQHIAGNTLLGRADPKCRFIFVHAPNSREWLNTSRSMLTYVLTYHQVMPAFLDFLFPFGRQEHARDFPFSGFRQETRLNPLHNGLNIPALDRSGQELRMSYSLKSVEKSDGQIHWPWSIRQTAVYHSLDIKTGVSSWVVVKGNQLMKSRMESVTESRSFRNANGFDGLARSFVSSLTLQLVICDWCSEDWRWYISFLEEAFQEKTRRTLAIQVERVTSPVEAEAGQMWTSSSTIPNSEKTPHSNLSLLDVSVKPLPPPELPWGHPPPPSGRPQVPVPSLSPEVPMDPGKFTFSDMQRVQFLEDKANEVLLILESNMHVLTELEMHYTIVRASEYWPEEFIQEGSAEITRFHNRIASIINDLRMQSSRTKTLLRLLADRKSLLYGILNYRNAEASMVLAMKSQQSTENMEYMTKDMHIIAQKTKQETVSMRIITLVTLFFLPGTFISTIMSTDIIQFQLSSSGESQKIFQLDAVQLYLAVTIPLTFLVFVSWYGVYWWVDRQEKLKKGKQPPPGPLGV